jgi:ATP-dependent RNA helicase RhlE
MTFEELGVPVRACEILREQGITEPNEVQLQAIPSLVRGSDAVIHAPTGSGKTLAYLLPLLNRLNEGTQQRPRALIVGPTRELATQIGGVFNGLRTRTRTALIFGGASYSTQLRALRQNPGVVIGCPGRLLDIIGRQALNLSELQYLVLDEADEMLDQGFAKDVEQIIGLTPKTRQTVLASATMPQWVRTMIAKHLRDPEIIEVEKEVEPMLEHGLLAVNQQTKTETLDRLLVQEKGQTIVFHRTKHGAKKLARDLTRMGHATGELQGNLSQNARDKAMASFRAGHSAVLVATNVAARGIDVAEVGLVVNFELPDTAEWLTHRVGRTARNGAKGRALTFVTPEDGVKWTKLRRQGAPDLSHVDPSRLLDAGEWEYRPHTVPANVSRPQFRRESTGSSRSLDTGRGEQRSRPTESRTYGDESGRRPGPRRGDSGRPEYSATRSEPGNDRSEYSSSRSQSGNGRSDYSTPRPRSEGGRSEYPRAHSQFGNGRSDTSTWRSRSENGNSQYASPRSRSESSSPEYRGSRSQSEQGRSDYASTRSRPENGRAEHPSARSRPENGRSEFATRSFSPHGRPQSSDARRQSSDARRQQTDARRRPSDSRRPSDDTRRQSPDTRHPSASTRPYRDRSARVQSAD